MRSLLLVDDTSFYPETSRVDVFNIYKKYGLILRGVRFLHHRFNILPSFKYIWYDEWKKTVHIYDKIVIFDTIFDLSTLDYIRNRNKSVELIFCYRNKVVLDSRKKRPVVSPEFVREAYKCQLYSYNREDCYKYNMTYYNQFFSFDLNLIKYRDNIQHDLFFIGNDRRRLAGLMRLADVFSQKGLSYKIMVVPDSNKRYTQNEKLFLSHAISYSEVLYNIAVSRCVVDFVTDSNYGLTYRPVEALMMRKKLMTNYSDIISYEFYRKENIFIIWKDNFDSLKDFIYSDYINIPKETLNKYTFDGFINTLFHETIFAQ
jgi:hypothetical protein